MRSNGQNHTVVLNFATQPAGFSGMPRSNAELFVPIKPGRVLLRGMCVATDGISWIRVARPWLRTSDELYHIL